MSSSTLDLVSFYYNNLYDESIRITRREGQVEYFVTFAYIEKAIEDISSSSDDIDNSNLKIIEIGAGTGEYSIELAKRGFDVVAVDLMPKHIEIINERCGKELLGRYNLVTHVEDARDLSILKDNNFDVVLCLGPLYHLFIEEDVNRAIEEAIRICKPEGYIFFAYLPQDSIVLSYFLRKNKFAQCYGKSLTSDFKPVIDPKEIFRGFYIEEFDALMTKFDTVEFKCNVATDGMTLQMREYVDALDDESFELWKQYCLKSCERKELQGFSTHMLWIGNKKDD